MAKVKTFAVEVEIVLKRTLYVEARRAGGAAEKVLTEEGWRRANAYSEPEDPMSWRREARVVKVREA